MGRHLFHNQHLTAMTPQRAVATGYANGAHNVVTYYKSSLRVHTMLVFDCSDGRISHSGQASEVRTNYRSY